MSIDGSEGDDSSGGGSSNGSGGGGDDDDDDDDDKSTTTTTSGSTTSTEVADVTMGGAGTTAYFDAPPTTASTNAATQTSIDSYLGSMFRSLYSSNVASSTSTMTGTAATATTTEPLCVEEQDPDSGSDETYCSCNGGSGSYPTLTPGTNPCGYTTLPTRTTTNSYPYTFTDPDGDIIACTTEGYLGTIAYCSGSRTTRQRQRHLDDFCDDTAYAATNTDTDKALTTSLSTSFTFAEWSVCGVSGGYSCTETASSSGVWDCTDANGGNAAQCTKAADSSSPYVTCKKNSSGDGENTYGYLLANCTPGGGSPWTLQCSAAQGQGSRRR
ncbi:hypothetical protein ASPACDRAFT_41762 [Aspergillus aculeatus ATCC 16872]|uniref:Uncharacterized protein n=1 Tax=Aspergillus aculeatus (strain ATCC 16872 / CBS 172.66 / WB 5094) TaxID=690307 RepID=A0A1L9WZ46_ASPA1|nr:uncharacterized protein ASPACDRAFT_41762 [Aspergillus aculeatus ATCC 16872]OJK01500.1 hypothetical protein ASPACDRAFT_41762 [Aspergillus aculeatus ATCC 16872]